LYYRKSFRFKPRFDLLAVVIGILIFILWVGLDDLYPHIGSGAVLEYGLIEIILAMIAGVVLAPIVEEFFTRYFLHRWVIDKNWKKVKLGKYTPASFVVTVLFFGFSHNRWLAGLVAGIILNLLFYKRKEMNSVVLAHAVANLCLGIYVIFTGAWHFW
jgi:uncharacterized protein